MDQKFWKPEQLWRGRSCFILAGGPSLTQADVNRLRGHRVITINSSLTKAVTAGLDDGVLYFTDTDWFRSHIPAIAAWPGLVTTVSPTAHQTMPRIKLLQAPMRGDFPEPGSEVIRGGRSSGHKAISLAIGLGSVRIGLLGYDMRLIGDRSHHHDEYRCRAPELYDQDFIPSFRGWNDAALKIGVTIFNATPESALKEFPFKPLDQLLGDAHG